MWTSLYLAFAVTSLRVVTLVYFVCVVPIVEACPWDGSITDLPF
jgi:hypothetical protein